MNLLFATFHIFRIKASSKILDFHWGDYNSSNPIGVTINRRQGLFKHLQIKANQKTTHIVIVKLLSHNFSPVKGTQFQIVKAAFH